MGVIKFDEIELVREYEKCRKCRIVAEKFGCSDETVRRALIKYNVPRVLRNPSPVTKKREIDQDETDLILATYYFTSATINDLAKEFKRSQTIISRLIKEKGHGLKECSVNAKKISDDEIRTEAGLLDAYQICSKYGISPERLARRAKAIGVDLKWTKSWRRWSDRALAYGCDKSKIDKTITIERLRARDGDICQICGLPVDDTDISNGHARSMYPTLDHIIPLSKGGSHTWDNVQLAHMRCNAGKCNRVGITVKRREA